MAMRWLESVFHRPERPYVHPYLAGAVLGVVLFLAFFLTGNGLGSSGATSRIDAALVDLVAPAHVDRTPYLLTTTKGPQISNRTRWAMSFAGGMIFLYGARMARGCTSGQALSGGATLAAG